jgi:dipeptidase E
MWPFKIGAYDMNPQMKLALGGGGGAADSLLLDEVFAAWIGAQGRLLYLPCALRGIRPLESCLEWITATFTPLGITRITMWTDLHGHQAGELDHFDAVYMGGGNTFALLAELRKSGFDNHLKEFARHGKAIYGGSAGAAVLGWDIRTVKYLDRNEVGLVEMQGLDLTQGYAIWVHYQPQDDNLIETYVRQYGQPVIALSERAGIVIESEGMRSVGFEPAYRFDGQDKVEVLTEADRTLQPPHEKHPDK